MKTQHVFDRRNPDAGRNAFRGPWNHESYKGDYAIDVAAGIDVRMHRKVIGACSIIAARSPERQSFRRTWAHIQEDATDVVVLCFIKKGYLRLEHPAGERLVRAGEFIAAKSIAPFFVECGAESDTVYEAMHLIVPAHEMRRHLGREIAAGFSMPVSETLLKIAGRMLSDLMEDDDSISEGAAQHLMDAALSIVADAIRGLGVDMSARPNHREIRLRAILRYIDLHLSDPTLSVSSVAEACNVSVRYIFSAFQRQGTTFSAVVWGKRLTVAAQWLSTSSAGDAPISEIAYRAGFKSAAHFARMFKRRFKDSPRCYRATASRASGRSFDTPADAAGAARH